MFNRCSHFLLIVISGLTWCVIGVLLMTLGMHHIMDGLRFWDNLNTTAGFSLFKFFSTILHSSQHALIVLVGLCLLVGYLKGHFILNRTVRSGVQRIISFPNPSSLSNIYTKKYYILIFCMMGLGMLLRWLKLPHDVHGAIDLAIGSALLKGALTYFRYALAERKGNLAQEKW